ncbi:MAG: hypothetical protein NTZ24_11005, partial [Deltaproteobacteria bacterium]|nr:hypothetical protein [Deltaproteobacteria bacterium]
SGIKPAANTVLSGFSLSYCLCIDKEQLPNRLLKKAHLLRCAARLVNRHTSMYASFLVFCAPCTWAFLNSLSKTGFFNSFLISRRAGQRDHLPGIGIA